MGLLDTGIEDPTTAGLLSLGLRLMSTPGKFGTALGQAGLGALQDVNAAKDSTLKRKMMQTQMDDVAAQAKLRDLQAQKAAEAMGMLTNVLGSQPQQSQYGLAGNGVSMGGVREQMKPQPGGLAGATPEQIAALKANGIDISNLWELTKFGKEMQPGYRRNADGSVDYFGNPEKGVGFNPRTNQVSVMPGAAETQAALTSANKTAEQSAQAPFEMVRVPRPDGSEQLMTKAQYIAALKAQAAGVPAPAANAAAASGDDSYRFDVGGKRGVFGGGDLGVTPNFAQQAQAEAGKKQAVAQVDQTMDQRKQIVEAGFSAPTKIASLKRLNSLVGDLDGGKLTLGMKDMASAFNSLGIKVDAKLGDKEAAQAALGEMALSLKNSSSGNLMPGAMSDGDRRYLEGMTPGLATSKEGRQQIISARIAMAERDQQIAQFVRNYEKKYGKLDNGFFDQLQQWSNANPLFGGK